MTTSIKLRVEEVNKERAMSKYVIFKTIILGVYKTTKAYREALTNAGFRNDGWVDDMLDNVQVSSSKIQLDLVSLSVANLGFKGSTRLDKIFARAKELGLELCSSEVGPALRLACPGQPYEEPLWIAMEPISDSEGGLRIFVVDYVRFDRWLGSRYGNPDLLRSLDSRFVFVLPRK